MDQPTAQAAADSAQSLGIAGAVGALIVSVLKPVAQLVPIFNEGKKLDKKIDAHKSLCVAEIKGRFDVLENRLTNGNNRFSEIERRAQEDRQAAADRHQEIIGYLMDIKGSK